MAKRDTVYLPPKPSDVSARAKRYALLNAWQRMAEAIRLEEMVRSIYEDSKDDPMFIEATNEFGLAAQLEAFIGRPTISAALKKRN